LVYSLTPESGIKKNLIIIVFFFTLFNYIKIKICMQKKIKKNKVNLLVYSLTPESGIKMLM